MEKIDFLKTCKSYYTAKNTPERLTLEPARYVSISGKGDPSGAAFQADIQALYPVAYGVKALCKAEGRDFGVPKLEGLWWFDTQKFGSPGMAEAPQVVPRSAWEYRLLLRIPDFADEALVARAVETVVAKKKMPEAERVSYFTLHEADCVQMLHVGPYSEEPASLQKMLVYMQARGLKQNGLHHEIYLSDFRKTAPGQLKTILREPVTG